MRDVRFFIAFELYNLICLLSGYKIAHWLNGRHIGPAGKYLRLVRSAPLVVRMMDRLFLFGEESHCDYLPYSAYAEAQLKRAGACVSIVEISYQARAEVL